MVAIDQQIGHGRDIGSDFGQSNLNAVVRPLVEDDEGGERRALTARERLDARSMVSTLVMTNRAGGSM
jgi:hypothetical protein